MNDDQPTATVYRLPTGEIVLNDPVAVSIWQVLTDPDRKDAYEQSKDRVGHFVKRMEELGKSPELTVIVLLQVDDTVGGMLADALMPGHNWNEIRGRGEEPYARGLASREPIRRILETVYPDAAQILAKNMNKTCVVMVSYSSATIFDALSHTQLT